MNLTSPNPIASRGMVAFSAVPRISLTSPRSHDRPSKRIVSLDRALPGAEILAVDLEGGALDDQAVAGAVRISSPELHRFVAECDHQVFHPRLPA
ncbi:MAG: hypothetical protein R3F11_12760 [Verrucomicrobiales bacterium]